MTKAAEPANIKPAPREEQGAIMHLACCVWAMTLPEPEMLRQVQDFGFRWIDTQPGHLRRDATRQLAKELELTISCLGASFKLPAQSALDHAEADARRLAMDHVKKALDHAADLCASTAYVVPGKDVDPIALRRFGNSLVELADYADAQNIRLALEHFPGTALSTARETLSFIKDLQHHNLYLLYDSGHIQMTQENPAEIIQAAGDRLGYVHFDDNDGEDDLHLGLLDGVMTEDSLRETLQALKDIDYDGALSLELNPGLPNVGDSLRRSREVLLGASRSLA